MSTIHFFNLLRAGLLGKPAKSGLFSNLDHSTWKAIYKTSVEQAVTGVVWDGVLTLPKELYPPKELWFQWLGIVLKIEKTNQQINALVPEILEISSQAGILMEDGVLPVALLKGQGTAALYPEPTRRTPGDIDIYAGKGYKLLEKYLPQKGFKRSGHSTKHSEYIYNNIMVENHHYVALFFCPWLAFQLSKLIDEWFPNELSIRHIEHQEVLLPPIWFEALFSVIHFRTHLHLEGVGWRHLCDWWIIKQQLLKTDKNFEQQVSRYEHGLKKLGLIHMENTMEELFKQLILCSNAPEQLSPIAFEVYKEMMVGGNFGYHAEDINNHTYSHQKGFWKTLWNLCKHDIQRSIRFFKLFPAEAIFSPPFRIGGYIRRRGK